MSQMATTTSAVKGKDPTSRRADSPGGLWCFNLRQHCNYSPNTEESRHGSLNTSSPLSHSMPGRKRNHSCILMLYKDKEPARWSDLFRVTQNISSWIRNRASVPGALFQLTVVSAQVTEYTFTPQNNKINSPEYTLLEMLSPVARLQEIHKPPTCTETRTTLPNAVLNYSCVKFIGYKTGRVEKVEGDELFLKVFSYYANTESKDFPGNCCVK